VVEVGILLAAVVVDSLDVDILVEGEEGAGSLVAVVVDSLVAVVDNLVAVVVGNLAAADSFVAVVDNHC
jgi:hypothetical protein